MDDLAQLEKTLTDRLLRWDRLSSWVHGICVVTFDLELGQVVETIWPKHSVLTEGDKTNVCYLAFPDSNSGVMGDSQYHFRIRLSPGSGGGASTINNKPENASSSASKAEVVAEDKEKSHPSHLHTSKIHSEFNRRCPTALAFDPAYLFGFSFFRQVKDSSIRRGYFQKSVILLSKLPLISLFSQAVSVIAQRYFAQGEAALEAACYDIDRWPLPIPGHTLELGLLGCAFHVMLPSLTTRSVESGCETVTISPTEGESSMNLIQSSSTDVDIFTCLLPVVEHMHALWELVLTAEPLVVMAATPTLCASTVQFLTTVIYPLSYCADYRPFYTIHNSDFKDITGSNSSALPNIILGVTNPFFGKALSHWPHVVKLGDVSGHLLPGAANNTAPGSPAANQSHATHQKSKLKNVAKLKMDAKPGIYSSTKPLLEKDKAIVKRIVKGVQMKRPLEVQSALIRRHFLELTQTFMIPLERYLASLMPLARNISPYRAPPKVKPFNPDEFIASLENGGPQLTPTVKGDWAGLYRRFFKSPNFVGWYTQRHREVNQKLQILHLECLSEAKIEHWIKDKEEVQLVDMVLRIRNKLTETDQVPDIIVERLNRHVETILKTLPEDLRAVLDKGNVLGSSSDDAASSKDVTDNN